MQVADFNPFSQETLAEPEPFWAALRAEAPVYQIPIPGTQSPTYLVSRRKDVEEVAQNPEIFSSIVPSDIWRWGDLGPALQPQLLKQGYAIVHTIASADPPIHARYRNIVNKIFLPGKVMKLLPLIQSSIDELLDLRVRGEAFDFMTQYAIPLPIMMISDMLGLPTSDRDLVRRYTDLFVQMVDPTSNDELASHAVAGFAEGQRYLAEYLHRFERDPNDTLLSTIANACDENGERLSLEERLSLSYLLMAAGNETTRNALALSAYYLASRPDIWAALKANRELVPNFVEEALRLGTPARVNPRMVTCDTELAGVPLKAGSVVFMIWGSANRDSAVIQDPEQIRLDRENARSHRAFGYGIHTCVGAPLARQELNLSVKCWLDRFDELRFAVPQSEIKHSPLFGFRSFPELPLIFA